MPHRREGNLAQIEAGVLDDSMPISSLLQKCIVLGGQAGSEKMRDWARQELNGYSTTSIPDYRHIPTGLAAKITNLAGYNPITQRIDPSVFPRQIIDFLRDDEGVDLEVAVLDLGVGELEALADRGKNEHWLRPPWAGFIVETLNKYNVAPNSRVEIVYWPLSDASLRGLLVRIRTALAEMIAELITVTPPSQEVPTGAAVDQAVNLVINGERTTIVVNQQTVSPASSTYHGPVFHGSVDGAQLAWNNQSVTQHNRVEQIAAGYEALAKATTEVLRQLPTMELSPETHEDAEAASNEVLAEIIRDEPRPGAIRRSLTVLRGCLTPVAAAGTVGAATGVSDAARAAARHAIDQLASY
ncbi:hypothetical protein ACN27F_28920 [Solwaraspora sp. WMMB335]|uniref:AbiTii domain-containing protein n=1 Tax=Solwaraspora sp. WMMB335 TaxID=3404118 RepID=UPI003B93B7C2